MNLEQQWPILTFLHIYSFRFYIILFWIHSVHMYTLMIMYTCTLWWIHRLRWTYLKKKAIQEEDCILIYILYTYALWYSCRHEIVYGGYFKKITNVSLRIWWYCTHVHSDTSCKVDIFKKNTRMTHQEEDCTLRYILYTYTVRYSCPHESM